MAIPDICHFFTLTHFESWKFYTRKVRKFTTNGAQSSNFLFFSGIFLHSAKKFTRTAFAAFVTNIRYACCVFVLESESGISLFKMPKSHVHFLIATFI